MDAKEVNEKLTYYFRPLSFPVAVKLLTAADKLPEKVKVPSRDFGHKIMTCQATAMARRHGISVAVGPDDVKCAPSAIGLGMVDPNTLEKPEGPEAVSKTLELGKYTYVVYSPLHSARFEPDVLVVYGNSAQIMRMVQAFTIPGKSVKTVATALADCVDIAYLVEDPAPYMILPSGGDRLFGTAQDFEMIFALPWSMLEECLNGLEMTHKLGFRYPVVSYLRYEPQLPPFLDLDGMRK
ncbi:MAG: DUF169 domain-containing protein [Deltaproteobacteria bacterium]|nr:DUF169 domain-containing protein [Deltaproteobacteria bacterium]MBW1818053.1 DUF169 domain-containing protein [Deltaproteobacteria bacterium]